MHHPHRKEKNNSKNFKVKINTLEINFKRTNKMDIPTDPAEDQENTNTNCGFIKEEL